MDTPKCVSNEKQCFNCFSPIPQEDICVDCLLLNEIIPGVKSAIIDSLLFRIVAISGVLFWAWAIWKLIFWIPRWINQIGRYI